jgi:hypothetical protein
MRESNAIVVVYDMPSHVEEAILALRESGFDLQNVSVLGPRDNFTGDPVASRSMPDGIDWSRIGRFWTGVGALLCGCVPVSLLDSDHILVAGRLATWIITAADNAQLFEGLSAAGAGLYSIGISRTRIMRYEAALKRRMYLVIVHGTSADVSHAKSIFQERHRNQTTQP